MSEVFFWTGHGLEEELRSLPVMQRDMASILEKVYNRETPGQY